MAKVQSPHEIALQFIEDHGADAKHVAMQQVLRCAASKDLKHATTWRQVCAAIIDLQTTRAALAGPWFSA